MAPRTLVDITVNPHRRRGTLIAWPAQALAYKIGELQFLAERRRAEDALGTRFDIRAFHDAILDHGPMPLSILHDQISRWIDAAARGHTGADARNM